MYVIEVFLAVIIVIMVLIGLQIISNGRKTRIDWNMFFLCIACLIWDIGATMFYAESNKAVSGAGLYLTELSILLAFFLIGRTFMRTISAVRTELFSKVLRAEGLLAVCMAILLLTTKFLRVEPVGMVVSFHYTIGPPFAIYAFFNFIVPIIFSILALASYKKIPYIREKKFTIVYVVMLLGVDAALQLHFWIPFAWWAYAAVTFMQFLLFYAYYIASIKIDTKNLNVVSVLDYTLTALETPVLYLSDAGMILAANSAAGPFFGYDVPVLLKMHIEDIFGANIFEPFEKYEQGNTRRVYDAKTRDGTFCQARLSFIYDKYGELRNVIMVVSDISEKMHMMEEMEATRKAAEAANHAKSLFLARTSHEIRTPMNAIVGMSEMILRENSVSAVHDHALSIKQASHTLLSLINEILDFSKIESGRMEIIEVKYQLSSVINDIANIIRMRLQGKDILFAMNIDPNLPQDLIGDEVRLRQVLLNILNNAAKYTQKGFISLDVSGRIENGVAHLRCVVADSGMGIREEDKEKLFKTFVQLDAEANRGVEGTGLGLTISKSLITAMGGDISLESEYGKGSVFTVSLPQRYTEYTRIAAVENAEEIQVLLYEGREIYADSIERSLRALGVGCARAQSQSAFLELANGGCTHIFVADYLYEGAKFAKGDTVVLLGIDKKEQFDARTIAMPAQTIAIANLLNNVQPDKSSGEWAGPGFSAPEARLLVVDDNETNLKVAKGLMAAYHMQVETCTSGRDAIALVTNREYDIIFMDHMMPEMDGIEATAILREKGDRTPIIALTANTVRGMREMFLQKGMDDFLSKPIDVRKLDEILGLWIPEKKQEQPREAATAARSDLVIEGVDVQLGLRRSGGDFATYLDILRTYASNNIALRKSVQEALAEQNISLFTTYVHSLKSASASIGALALAEQAQLLEDAGKRMDIDTIEEHVESFHLALEEMIRRVDEAVRRESAGGTSEAGSGAVLRESFEKMREHLDAFDMSAANQVLEDLLAYSWPEDTTSLLRQMDEALLCSDFDEADQIMERLLEQ